LRGDADGAPIGDPVLEQTHVAGKLRHRKRHSGRDLCVSVFAAARLCACGAKLHAVRGEGRNRSDRVRRQDAAFVEVRTRTVKTDALPALSVTTDKQRVGCARHSDSASVKWASARAVLTCWRSTITLDRHPRCACTRMRSVHCCEARGGRDLTRRIRCDLRQPEKGHTRARLTWYHARA
jgi:hypothetical protein